MTGYPENIAPETISIVTEMLLGRTPNVAKAMHAGWDTAGWILGKVYPDGDVPPEKFLGSSRALSPQEACDALKKLSTPVKAKTLAEKNTAVSFDWMALLQAILAAMASLRG